MVFYRKYRPQKIQELDSEEVRKKLSAILSKKDIPHAFLFYGPKGLGKTSAARIVAKVVNCAGKIKPCNKCDQCLSITNGTNLDILEIDAASNRGIDEIRELREKVKLAPSRARTKVYIIDEAHMLTREAFNALLKTLEEPPSHVVFILCTTEQEKLPETIVSRCVAVHFKKATNAEITRSFTRIIKQEKINIEKEAIGRIAELSGGSFRDGAKILEQLVTLAGRRKITKVLIESEYQSEIELSEFLERLFARDIKQAIILLEKEINQGKDPKLFIEHLLYSLHGLLLAKIGINNLQDEFEKSIVARIEMEQLKKLVELFERAAGEIKTAVVPQLPIELAIIEWGNEFARGPVTGFPPASARSKWSPSATKSLRAVGNPSTRTTPRDQDFLASLIDKVKPLNHSIAGVLRSCSARVDGKKVIIEARYKFHKERLEEEKTKNLLEKVASEIHGKPVMVSVLLKGGDTLA